MSGIIIAKYLHYMNFFLKPRSMWSKLTCSKTLFSTFIVTWLSIPNISFGEQQKQDPQMTRAEIIQRAQQEARSIVRNALSPVNDIEHQEARLLQQGIGQTGQK